MQSDIVGRSFVHDIQGVVSTYHLIMLYVSIKGTTTKLGGNKEITQSCYRITLKKFARRIPVEELSPPRKEKRDKKKALVSEGASEKEAKK